MAAVVEASAFLLGLFLCYNMNEMSIPPHPFMDRYVLMGSFLFALF
ncbi:hypothetical protein BI000_gp26 [Streptococcus phage 9871]|uniref:Uncharacterized protein n=2 Tax=Piorkowskivirus TaxID=3044792 RepID=A0A191KBM2_9CAUD|nr:hypothetical protein BI000_gp26 [Streptococcus phage 9871]YP_009289377.1 hypothetical protein BIZ99_gp26 [Streptococcus phage 9872]YP_009785984.1 hypothetical protein HOR14_gp26 [Streptococcus phage 9873]AYR04471.1 hypothetical protein SW17_025 [Streptococcus phage SW17]AMQ65720.1 hypothetical protein P9871_26 [Streptococcus phage 9871]AMQ65769.1 hypothetical protein P9872_26 [Streptococcus phage 9872]AMQ65818.1 hypothetical protein P9873_26 [Streptococcus phage 9873]